MGARQCHPSRGQQSQADSERVVVQRQLQVLRGEKAEPEYTGHQHEAGDTSVAETAVAEQPHGHQRILGPALPCHEEHQGD